MGLYEIDAEQMAEMEAFAAANDGPIVMVNFMQVREEAIYAQDMPDDLDTTPCSGREAMARYSKGSAGVRAAVGASMVWRGNIAGAPIAAAEEQWNLVARNTRVSRGAPASARST